MAQPDYSYWKAACAGERPAYHDDDPQTGFYRIKNQDGSYDAVAIWFDAEGVCLAKRAHRMVDDVNEVWRMCAQRPVAHPTYKQVMDGGEWPDVVKMPTIGDNSGDVPLSTLYKGMIDDKLREFSLWLKEIGGKITSQDHKDRADAFKGVIARLRIDGDKERVKEKEPHLKAGRDVDTAWKPIENGAKSAEAKIAEATKPFLLEQDRIRRIAEDAARAAAQAAREASSAPTAPEPIVETYVAPPKATPRGGTRLVNVKTPTIADIEKVKAAYAKTTMFEDAARTWALGAAVKLAEAGMPIDGVTITEEPVAK